MRGEVEIMPGWDDKDAFCVMVWDRHRDSGYVARAFPTRQRAIDFAEGMVEASNLTMHCAQIVPLAGGGA